MIGSSSSDKKGAWLKSELGLDEFINYRTEGLRTRLAEFAPDGIDCYFDNVGCSHLEAAIDSMRKNSIIALSDAVEQYNLPNYRGGPDNFCHH